MKIVVILGWGWTLCSAPAVAWAADDGAYHRIGGDVALSAEGGLAYAKQVAPTVHLRALYLATAGLYATAAGRTSDAAPWSAGAGIELRPLFLPRFLLDLEQGPATSDLSLDSLSLRIGARYNGFRGPPSLELGMGAEVPLRGTLDGPFVGIHASFVMTQQALARAQTRDMPPPSFFLQLTFGWRVIAESHVVDAGDRMYR